MMNFNDPPTLEELAGRSLLQDEALTISVLQELPMQFFPPLFKDAFINRQPNILRHMVATWPFPCLPVGALMKTRHLETLKAILDGLDLLVTQKTVPRRGHLQVLDLRAAHHDFWNDWAGMQHVVCSPNIIDKIQPVGNHATLGRKQAITILMNVSLKSRCLSKYLEYFFWWAKQRKAVIQVICQKLTFGVIPVYDPLNVLKVYDPGSIQILEISTCWDTRTLALLTPGLGQMKNLQKLIFKKICRPLAWGWEQEMEVWCIEELFSQFSELHNLQHLYLNDVYFLYEHLDQMLRCLESPLETLAITCCMLSQSDMKYLSQCPRIHQLKHLDLSRVPFINLSHLFLGHLLERVTATLKTLKLKDCKIKDFHVSALLPALSQCSQLTEVNFEKNSLSMDSLKKLLQHTANLTQLTLEKYPAPDEVYDDTGIVIPDRFVQLCSELMDTLKVIRQPNKVYFVSRRCLRCLKFFIYNLETKPCLCWQ